MAEKAFTQTTKKQLRSEAKYFESMSPFTQGVSEEGLFQYLASLIVKANGLLAMTGSSGKPKEEMKMLEMSLNKKDILLEKIKLFVIKLDQLYIIVPIVVSKIEVKMRNVVINSKPKLKEISRFIKFYLDVQEAYSRQENDMEGIPVDTSLRTRGSKKTKNQATVVPMDSLRFEITQSEQQLLRQGENTEDAKLESN